ncbi:uncharacterized protein LOC125777126 [Bactrocera dorsalis]|uniref:Uncharacterized protein LOC125777126 n=1 Tax=Bactrocera dorsalis TaxID=27457 RepID=A0ABM3JDH1_BACDO|nr:uncharacterized protein LOC125777126 [Bactrocera dorsalis]
MEAQTILNMTVTMLKERLKEAGLPTNGRKKELRDRLLTHYGLLNDDDESESEVESVEPLCESVLGKGPVPATVPHFTFREIEESLASFNGTDGQEVNQWAESFEENAHIVGWSEIHKFIYAKQLLRGAARAFIRSQTGIRDWISLKQALIDEFETSFSSAEAHRLLRNRQKRHNETFIEFLYALMEIGKRVKLEEASVIEYFILGIPDSKLNKSVLYQARNIRELKEQIKIYEKIKYKLKVEVENRVSIKEDRKENTQRTILNRACFKCGETSHIAKDCTSQQFRCYKCNKVGHKRNECPTVQTKGGRDNLNTITEVAFKPSEADFGLKFKMVKVGNVIFPSLVDTGSRLCLIRVDTVEKLNLKVKPNKDKRVLGGIGNSEVVTLGSFETRAKVDDIEINIIFHIVNNRDLQYPALIGRSILGQVDLIVGEESDRFLRKDKPDICQEENKKYNRKIAEEAEIAAFSMICIDEQEPESTYDLSHLDKGKMLEVEKLIAQYEPKRIKFSPVEMKIVLKDDVYHFKTK